MLTFLGEVDCDKQHRPCEYLLLYVNYYFDTDIVGAGNDAEAINRCLGKGKVLLFWN